MVLLLTLVGWQGGKCHCGVVGRSPTTATGLEQTSECLPCLPKIGEESEKVSQATGDKAWDHVGAGISHVRDMLKDGLSDKKWPMAGKDESRRAGRLVRALPQKAGSTVSSLRGQGSHQIW